MSINWRRTDPRAEHEVPRPVRALHHALQSGFVDEHAEADTLAWAKARLLAETTPPHDGPTRQITRGPRSPEQPSAQPRRGTQRRPGAPTTTVEPDLRRPTSIRQHTWASPRLIGLPILPILVYSLTGSPHAVVVAVGTIIAILDLITIVTVIRRNRR